MKPQVSLAFFLFLLTCTSFVNAKTTLAMNSNVENGAFIRSWNILDPIAVGNHENHEEKFKEDMLLPKNAKKSVKNGKLEVEGKTYNWQHYEFKSNSVNLKQLLGGHHNTYVYAWAEFEASKSKEYLLTVGSDDGVSVWVNGKPAHYNWAGRAVTKDEDVFAVPLKKGKNQILLKVFNTGGDWGYAARILPDNKKNDVFVQSACFGSVKNLELLLSKGVNVKTKNLKGVSAIQCAKAYDKQEAYDFLFSFGAGEPNKKADFNALVDMQLERFVEPGSPGYAVGIIKDGKVIHAKGYGLANLEYDIPIIEKSVFRIASVSKQFTAASIVVLINQGKLSLDDTLNNFFPKFPKYAEKITVAQLLNHTSGVRDYLALSELMDFRGSDYFTDQEVEAWLQRQRGTNFTPGEKNLYSNSGYWLLGQIVQKVSGKNLADFAAEEIFEPLGMKNTSFHNNHRKIVKNRASGYSPSKDGGFQISMTNLDLIGDGGVFTTIEDLAKWDAAYYSKNIFGNKFWELMERKGKLNNGKELNYASGLRHGSYRGLDSIGHGGAFFGFRAFMDRFPEQKMTVIVLSNRSDAYPRAQAMRLQDILLKDEIAAKEKEIQEHIAKNKEAETNPQNEEQSSDIPEGELSFALPNDYKKFIGTFWEAKYASSITIEEHEGELKFSNTHGLIGTMEYRGDNVFQAKTQWVSLRAEYVFASNGETKIKIMLPDEPPHWAKKYTPVSSAKDPSLKPLVGKYYSEELDTTYEFVFTDDGIRYHSKNSRDQLLEPISNRILNHYGIEFVFNKDYSGFSVSTSRAKNIVFKRI